MKRDGSCRDDCLSRPAVGEPELEMELPREPAPDFPQREAGLVREEALFTVRAGDTVRVRTCFQRILVVVSPSQEVRIVTETSLATGAPVPLTLLDACKLDLRQEGRTLFVRAPGRPREPMQAGALSASVTLHLPPGVHAKLESTTGACGVTGHMGPATLSCRTVSGAVDIRGGCWDLEVATVSGPVSITLDQPAASLAVRSSSGEILLEGASASLRARSAAGTVTAHDLAGTAEIITGSGPVRTRWTRKPSRTSCSLESGSGTIEVSVPADTWSQVDWRSGSGRVAGELPSRAIHHTGDRPGRTLRLSGRSGSGDLLLETSASTGQLKTKR